MSMNFFSNGFKGKANISTWKQMRSTHLLHERYRDTEAKFTVGFGGKGWRFMINIQSNSVVAIGS